MTDSEITLRRVESKRLRNVESRIIQAKTSQTLSREKAMIKIEKWIRGVLLIKVRLTSTTNTLERSSANLVHHLQTSNLLQTTKQRTRPKKSRLKDKCFRLSVLSLQNSRLLLQSKSQIVEMRPSQAVYSKHPRQSQEANAPQPNLPQRLLFRKTISVRTRVRLLLAINSKTPDRARDPNLLVQTAARLT